MGRSKLAALRVLVVAGLMMCQVPQRAKAQDPADEDGGPVVRDSGVGYIDSAIPFSHVRTRVDNAYRLTRPTRAEYIYARGAPLGPGLPFPETRVDYQDIRTYVEVAPQGRFSGLSGFIEVPVRYLNPEINDNQAGLADMNVGFKWAFWQTYRSIVTTQFRTYIPTGNAQHGLGTSHAALEPGVLFNYRALDLLTVEGQVLYWIPAGGTSFAGSLFQYGLGVSFLKQDPCGWWVTPVVEFVGWTVLSGQQTAVHAPGVFTTESAAGDTIVNVKAGLRGGLGRLMDLYAGYGRSLTGDTWYTDIVRVEFRVKF